MKLRHPIQLIALLSSMLLLAGCEKAQSAGKDSGSNTLSSAKGAAKSELPVLSASLLDGFEGPEHTVWAFDSADDEGIAEYSSEGTTQGSKALKISIPGKGSKGRFHLRRDMELDP